MHIHVLKILRQLHQIVTFVTMLACPQVLVDREREKKNEATATQMY